MSNLMKSIILQVLGVWSLMISINIAEKKIIRDSKQHIKHNKKQDTLRMKHEQIQASLPDDKKTTFQLKPYTSAFKRQLTIEEFLSLPHEKVL
ncbi:hypothetical protein [Paenibacillus sp. FSL L8-0709]|uniref:hypothetical protein n=1 Tax=Paenibacillus sp. FSL L8-0709 TaxID=2975312 RepID=UPI0030FC8518